MTIYRRYLAGALLASTSLPAMAHDNGLLHAHPEYGFLLVAAALAVAWFDARARRRRTARATSETTGANRAAR